jgi:methyl-accepting chemotaxis protein
MSASITASLSAPRNAASAHSTKPATRRSGLPVIYRIMAIIGVAIISLIGQLGVDLYQLREQLLEDRASKTRELVEVAYGVVTFHAAQAERGTVSREEAQAAALAALQGLRYSGNEYFWVNDQSPKLLMHPFAKDLVGKDVSNYADPDGKRIFIEFSRIAREKGGGEVAYRWPKPGADEPVAKISYVKAYAPWGWVIGSGIYLDDVDAVMRSQIIKTGITVTANGVMLVLFGWLLARAVARPLQSLTGAIERLAERDWTTEVPHTGKGDEIGAIARAVEIFKTNGIEHERLQNETEAMRRAEDERRMEREAREAAAAAEIAALCDEIAHGHFQTRLDEASKEGFLLDVSRRLNHLTETLEQVTGELADVMHGMAEGDVSRAVHGEYHGVFADLKQSANRMASTMRSFAEELLVSSATLRQSSAEISAGSEDLAHRTESQAATLEETAAAMHEVTTTVRQNADNAKAADELAEVARSTAHRGGDVVAGVVEAMNGIEQSAQKISDIVAMIDEIAFQTNLLALNASVEAARAGDAGKGFAVVAQEVRALAQRSANASKEIKDLIQASTSQVQDGVRQVHQAGEALKDIVGSVEKVTSIVGEIATASAEQSRGLDEVNIAIGQMDEITQRNAALVEETHASAQSLANMAQSLAELTSFFQLGEKHEEHRQAPRHEGRSGDMVTVNGKEVPLRNWSRIGLFFGPLEPTPPLNATLPLTVSVATDRGRLNFACTGTVARIDGDYIAVRYTCEDAAAVEAIKTYFAADER